MVMEMATALLEHGASISMDCPDLSRSDSLLDVSSAVFDGLSNTRHLSFKRINPGSIPSDRSLTLPQLIPTSPSSSDFHQPIRVISLHSAI